MNHGSKAQAAQRAIQGASGDSGVGREALAELALEYGVHPTMISIWKQELVKNAKDLFERGNKKAADPQRMIDNLHCKIGQLQVERDFLAGQPAIARLLKGER